MNYIVNENHRKVARIVKEFAQRHGLKSSYTYRHDFEMYDISLINRAIVDPNGGHPAVTFGVTLEFVEDTDDVALVATCEQYALEGKLI